MEAVFAKGDRRLSKVLEEAHKLGCRFDGWNDCFSYEKWQKAFELSGIDPEFYAYRKISYDEILPWDIIDIGVTKEFFISEHKKAYEADVTASCRDNCAGCGATCFKGGVCFEQKKN